jgi:osmotically inducible protein OsmC
MKRRGRALWKGGLREGRGLVSTESRSLFDASFCHSARFEHGSGTNPEELIAAAYASCVSMALAAELDKASMNPEEIETQSVVTLDRQGGGWKITALRIDVRAKIPNADAGEFRKAAETAVSESPVSTLLNAPVTLTAILE